jgi:hypothetical protein
MEFDPAAWDCFPAEEFNSAAPRAASALHMELLIQVRPNGRMLDHFRIGLGGTSIINASFPLASVFSFPAAKDWTAKYQIWPRDIDLRRNMATTGWKDLPTLVASRDILIISSETEELVTADVVTEAIQSSKAGAAVRFAVIVGEDSTVSLQLQGLPASASILMGKPAFRG